MPPWLMKRLKAVDDWIGSNPIHSGFYVNVVSVLVGIGALVATIVGVVVAIDPGYFKSKTSQQKAPQQVAVIPPAPDSRGEVPSTPEPTADTSPVKIQGPNSARPAGTDKVDGRKVAGPDYWYQDPTRGEIVRIQAATLDDRTRNLVLYSFGAKLDHSDEGSRTLSIRHVGISNRADGIATECVFPRIVRLAYEIRGSTLAATSEGVGHGYVCLEQEPNGEEATRKAIANAVADLKKQIHRVP